MVIQSTQRFQCTRERVRVYVYIYKRYINIDAFGVCLGEMSLTNLAQFHQHAVWVCIQIDLMSLLLFVVKILSALA